MSSKNKKTKKKKKVRARSQTVNKKKSNSKSKSNKSNKSKTLSKPKHKPKSTSAPKIKKQSKLKFKKFEKCPGYEDIVKAQNFAKEKKYKSAIKYYSSGCDELENYTKNNIDNALEKRSRMERIHEYRQKMQKLQNQALVKSKPKPKKEEKQEIIPLNKTEGYYFVQQAIQAKNNNKYDKAIQLYERGLIMLEQELFNITDGKEKKKRIEKINNWRSEQQWCRNQIENSKIKGTKTNRIKKKKSTVNLKNEKGYQFCQTAEEFAKDKKYDAAIKWYEKGIPLLEDKMLYGTDSSSQKRERAKHIEAYRHSLQSLKNRKIRRKSTKFKATKIPANLSKKRRDISGGVLYKNIKNGTLSVDVIKNCHRLSMYQMLPIIASSCIHAPLPFRSFIGDTLIEAMNAKVEISGSLEQRLRFFLFSYYEEDAIQELWGDHPAMPTIADISDINANEGDEKEDDSKRSFAGDNDEQTFEEVYLEKDAILFFRKVSESNYPEVGQEIVVNTDYMDIYDLMGQHEKINKVRIEKIFKSNAKPLLLTGLQKQSDRKYKEVSKFIIKQGDDLRLDNGVMHMFRFFNSIWSEEGLEYNGYPIEALLYGVVPMGNDFGAIEFIPGCRPLRHVSDYYGKLGDSELHKLVATAAGSYIASFVLGVRDRHFDNVLIKKDGTLFHIDFGYVMGAKLKMDTSKIAITNDLCKLFENHWDSFIDVATNAFMTLRLHYQDILDYSQLVFDFVHLETNPSEFLYKMLKMQESDKNSEEIMRNKLASAPSSFHTKLKNAAHYVATL